MNQPPTQGPFQPPPRPGPDPGNLPGSRGRGGGWFSRLFRRNRGRPTPAPPPERQRQPPERPQQPIFAPPDEPPEDVSPEPEEQVDTPRWMRRRIDEETRQRQQRMPGYDPGKQRMPLSGRPQAPEPAPPEYRPPPFSNPADEHYYQSNTGTHQLSPTDEEHARDLYQKGFIDRGPGSKQARDDWFDFTGEDPRRFPWKSWRSDAGSP